MTNRPRPLGAGEIEALLGLDVPARLATLEPAGFPHVTPVWFVWADGTFVMTSVRGRPHLRRLAADPRAGVCMDVEDAERPDGQRPNRQVRAIGVAELLADPGGMWTTRITQKSLRGPGAVGAQPCVWPTIASWSGCGPRNWLRWPVANDRSRAARLIGLVVEQAPGEHHASA